MLESMLRCWRLATLGCLSAGLLAASPRLAAPGDLDPSFGQAGKAAVQTNPLCSTGCIGSEGSYGQSLLLQPDGAIVLAGSNLYLRTAETVPPLTSLVRFTAKGLLDTLFGSDGIAEGPPFEIRHIYEAHHGQLLLIGPSGYTVAPGKPAGVRFNQGVGIDDLTGTLTSVFGPGTRWRQEPQPVLDAQIDRSGRMVVVTSSPGLRAPAGPIEVTRFLPNGTPDRTFGSDGLVILHGLSPRGPVEPCAFALQADGSIVVLARSGWEPKLFLARLTARGKLDVTFGPRRGIVPLPGDQVGYSDLGVTPDKQVFVAVGQSWPLHEERLQLVHITAAGRFDKSFGHDGIASDVFSTRESGTSWEVEPKAIAFDAAGNPVVAGTRYPSGGHVFPQTERSGTTWFLARYTRFGRDCSFGRNGLVRSNGYGSAMAVSVQPNGHIVVAGNWEQEFMAARYMGGGRPRTCPGEGRPPKRRSHRGRRQSDRRR